jgi:hypothetical protein
MPLLPKLACHFIIDLCFENFIPRKRFELLSYEQENKNLYTGITIMTK